jgi:nucleoside triphosphate diphosphatase
LRVLAGRGFDCLVVDLPRRIGDTRGDTSAAGKGMAGESTGNAGAAMERLAGIMRRLRAPEGGCPWDLEQDFESIAPYTIEEAYEVADAIARRDWAGLKGELGDLLLQAVYHAQMAEEAGHFTLPEVIGAISEKMVARHPHVFGGATERSAASQTVAWEAQKAAERAARAQGGVLDDVPLALPGLTRAVKLQRRAARVGFDWPDAARAQHSPAEVAEEFGDLLFAMANLARHLEVDPEAALRAANDKFSRRFRAVEAALAAEGRRPQDSTLAEMNALWDAAKAAERGDAGAS